MKDKSMNIRKRSRTQIPLMIKRWINKNKFNEKVSLIQKLRYLSRAKTRFKDWLIKRDSAILSWSMTRKSQGRDVVTSHPDEADQEVGAVLQNTIVMLAPSNNWIPGRSS